MVSAHPPSPARRPWGERARTEDVPEKKRLIYPCEIKKMEELGLDLEQAMFLGDASYRQLIGLREGIPSDQLHIENELQNLARLKSLKFIDSNGATSKELCAHVHNFRLKEVEDASSNICYNCSSPIGNFTIRDSRVVCAECDEVNGTTRAFLEDLLKRRIRFTGKYARYGAVYEELKREYPRCVSVDSYDDETMKSIVALTSFGAADFTRDKKYVYVLLVPRMGGTPKALFLCKVYDDVDVPDFRPLKHVPHSDRALIMAHMVRCVCDKVRIPPQKLKTFMEMQQL
jgi:hypothetical protein